MRSGTEDTGSQAEAGRTRTLLWQSLAWCALVTALWTLDTLTKIETRERTGVGLENFRLITEQVTSAIGVLAMVGFVVWWLGRFPIQKSSWLSSVVGHVIGSAIFSLGHYAILYGLRRVVYAVADVTTYPPANLLANLAFEYQKDVKIYVGIVAIVLLHQTYVSRQDAVQTPEAAARKKLLVQTRTGEAVIDYDQLDYLESARNYVSVFANGREHLMRSSMSALLASLGDSRFVRTHRSYAVNLDKVNEILSIDAKFFIRMQDGRDIPLSRQYRDALRQRIAGRADSGDE